MAITLREMINQGKATLESAGVDSPDFDSRVLCSFVTGISLSELALHYRDTVEEVEKLLSEEGAKDRSGIEQEFDGLITRRAAREPLQYITKEQDFMGFTFRTDERGLIPRLDTEILATKALEALREMATKRGDAGETGSSGGQQNEAAHDSAGVPGNTLKVLDLCCGTGAIGISVAKLWAEENDTDAPAEDQSREDSGSRTFAGLCPLDVMLSDIDERVLSLAKENAEKLGALDKVRLIKSDLFESVPDTDIDLIVSNPPYIPTEVISGLQEEVRTYEPMAALDGGGDGLVFYRQIIKEAPSRLADGGYLMLEIGSDQGESVTGLLRAAGCFDDINVIQDLAGLDRVVRCRYSGR